MKADPNEFFELRKLLAWKRHEKPPPYYFTGFSEDIIARLRDSQDLVYVPWWEKWLNWFDARPVLVGAYGVAVCGLLLTGVTLRQVRDEAQDNAFNAHVAVASHTRAESSVTSNRVLHTLGFVEADTLSSTLPVMSYGLDGITGRHSDWRLTPASLNYH